MDKLPIAPLRLLLTIILLARLIAAQIDPTSACATGFIVSCIDSAVISVCGQLTEASCICASTAAIGTGVGSCLLGRCPFSQVINLASVAVSACSQWSVTHTLSGSALSSYLSTASLLPPSTSFSSTPATNTAGITDSPPSPTTVAISTTTSTTTAPPAPLTHLSDSAKIGIGVGSFAGVAILLAVLLLFLRHRRRRRSTDPHRPDSPSGQQFYELPDKPPPSELPAGFELQELPDKRGSLMPSKQELEVQRQNTSVDPSLAGFEFGFQHNKTPEAQTTDPRALGIVEADSRTARVGFPRGRQAGTEATVFDFESQKVLVTPEIRSDSARSSPAGSERGRDGCGGTGAMPRVGRRRGKEEWEDR